MSGENKSGDNVVRFPGGVPSLKELFEETPASFPSMTGAIIVAFSNTGDGEINVQYCGVNKLEMAMAAARLTVLAGSGIPLEDDR